MEAGGKGTTETTLGDMFVRIQRMQVACGCGWGDGLFRIDTLMQYSLFMPDDLLLFTAFVFSVFYSALSRNSSRSSIKIYFTREIVHVCVIICNMIFPTFSNAYGFLQQNYLIFHFHSIAY